jgi:hypothetical protein
MVKTQLLEDFVSQRFHWKSLTPHDQMGIAKEVLRLRGCIDADIDSGYALHTELLAWMDQGVSLSARLEEWLEAFNVMTHRPKI